MQSDRKKRTYIVTIEEQAEEKPTPAQDEDISKEPEPASGLEEVQKEPCKAEKPRVTTIEVMSALLAIGSIVLSASTTFLELVEKLEEKSTLRCEITCVFGINIAVLVIVVLLIGALAGECFGWHIRWPFRGKKNKKDK